MTIMVVRMGMVGNSFVWFILTRAVCFCTLSYHRTLTLCDGYNDVWAIKGISSGEYIFSKISIFDRYGKLLKNMTINQNFWDGTYNGITLPTNDYWYSVELLKLDGSIFVKQGHFTLRR